MLQTQNAIERPYSGRGRREMAFYSSHIRASVGARYPWVTRTAGGLLAWRGRKTTVQTNGSGLVGLDL